MKIATFIAGPLAGLILGYLLCVAAVRHDRRRTRAKRTKTETPVPRRFETAKLALWTCLLMGFAWVWCSYILAFLGKDQIAESLSQVAVTEIIGVVLAYCIKSTVENLSKNNCWPDKESSDEPDDSAGAG